MGVLISSHPDAGPGAAANNTVGGSVDERNVISGNGRDGIQIGFGAFGNRVMGNYIGVGVGGVGAVANGRHGVAIFDSPHNTIGGTSAPLGTPPGNVISGNTGSGVFIGDGALGGGATRNRVLGNIIGLDLTGTIAIPNEDDGVLIRSSPGNMIGGSIFEGGNVISGNRDFGVTVTGLAATGIQSLGNFIGTDARDTGRLGNGLDGVVLDNASGTVVGGTSEAVRNVVSGNVGRGILITGPDARSNVLRGNYVGTDYVGTAALGNSGDGVVIHDAPGMVIGGTQSGAGNIISANDGNGLVIEGAQARGTFVHQNIIGSGQARTETLCPATWWRNSTGTHSSSRTFTRSLPAVAPGRRPAGPPERRPPGRGPRPPARAIPTGTAGGTHPAGGRRRGSRTGCAPARASPRSTSGRRGCHGRFGSARPSRILPQLGARRASHTSPAPQQEDAGPEHPARRFRTVTFEFRDGGAAGLHRVGFNTVLQGVGLAGVTAAAGGLPAFAGDPPAPVAAPSATTPSRRRVLRVAHLTDVHVQPELKAAEGLAACLRHVQAHADAPQLILNTGDCIMDSMKRDRARTELQWRVWNSVWRAECSLPVEHAIGNHDVWGWNKGKSQTTGSEAGWGKRWALDALGLARSYRSFDRGGWHFVVLDGIQPFEDGYAAALDADQFAWLESDLRSTPAATPVLVMSHIPIFSIAPLMDPKTDLPDDGSKFGRAAIHDDCRRIKDLFKRHPNVKVCVSGHIHLVDRVDYAGVTYFCDGAVSGNWWKGSRFGEREPGYALLDLSDDGSVERRYIQYGWVAAQPDGPGGEADKAAA